MLTSKQISEIREHLERAQNPLFFFDNDPDGLCAFLLLQRFIGRGKGFPIKSFPKLDESHFRKVVELGADYIFVLDKPEVSEEFLKEAEQRNLPVVWIDHHDVEKLKLPDFVSYYNDFFNKNGGLPTTELAYEVTQKKEDLWIAVAGCISDRFVPDYYSGLKKDYPEMYLKSDDAFDILYNSGIGKVVRMMSFGLKDRVTNVIQMLKFLMKAQSPAEVLEEGRSNFGMHKRFEQIDKKYRKFLGKAVGVATDDNVLFFSYSGDMSISSDLANELSFRFPEKIIVVAYLSGTKINISARGKDVRKIILKALEGLEGATGGGHEEAVGAMIHTEDLEVFRGRVG